MASKRTAEHTSKQKKKEVSFGGTKTFEVPGSTEERQNALFVRQFPITKKLADEIGGRTLADRSLESAEAGCCCSGEKKCYHPFHLHNTVLHFNGQIMHCANAFVMECDKCSKQICGVCIPEHLEYHNLFEKPIKKVAMRK